MTGLNAETLMPPIELPPLWQALDRRLVSATKLILFLIGATFTILIFGEVVSRFMFNNSISQTNATARILLVWFFMLGAGLAFRQGAHVGLDALTRRLTAWSAAAVYCVAQIMILIFFLQMIWAGYLGFDSASRQVDGTLGISLGWVMAAFPIGFALLIYHQIAANVGLLRQRRIQGRTK